MFNKIKELIITRINNLLTKGILALDATKQLGNLQMMHVQLSETQARDIPRQQNYGFFSMPITGANCIVCNFNGQSISSSVIVASMPEYEPIGVPGDVVVFHKNGSMIKLTEDKIEITSLNPINIYSDNIKLGDTATSKLVKESFMSVFNSHTHICAASGSASATPLPTMKEIDLTRKVSAT
jgi:phage gp45-like